MKRAFIVIGASLALISAAHAFGLGLGNRYGKLGLAGNKGTVIPQPNGDILLVDGSSFLLQVDNASLICRAGGC